MRGNPANLRFLKFESVFYMQKKDKNGKQTETYINAKIK